LASSFASAMLVPLLASFGSLLAPDTAVGQGDRRSMLWAILLEGGELAWAGVGLIARLPFGIGHAVNDLAGGVLVELDAAGLRGLLVPVRQAIAAKAGEIHEVDILDVVTLAQMFEQPPKRRSFQLVSRRLIQLCHGELLPWRRRFLAKG